MNSPFSRALLGAMLLIAGCTESDVITGPSEGWINYSQINLCAIDHELGTPLVWQNFQIRNNNPTTPLKISNIEIRGDASCAFKCFRSPVGSEVGLQSCPQESASNPPVDLILTPGEAAIVRIEYTPTALDVTDYAALVITSKAVYAVPSLPDEPDAGADTDSQTDTGKVNDTATRDDAGANEEEVSLPKLAIPMCGRAIATGNNSDGGIDAGDGGAIDTSECPGYCGDPLPEGAPGCLE
ncbi:MAG: hypothetical protein QNJ97_00995 [Myxococcota bacterium]|nr:hypothetical protein [Myxococcota bacterium]